MEIGSLPDSILQWLTDAGWDTAPALRCPDHATGLNTLMRSIGTATASAVAAVLLAQYVVTTGGHDYTTATGFRLAFAAAGVAALVALTIAWFLPRHEKVYPDASVPIAPDASVPVDPEVCTPVVAETGAPVDEQAGGRSVDGSPAGAIPGSPPIRVPTARGDR